MITLSKIARAFTHPEADPVGECLIWGIVSLSLITLLACAALVSMS